MRAVKIYTTDYCGYCTAALALLGEKGIPVEEIDCSKDRETRAWLIEQTGQRTVPQIFIGDVPIGGYRELRALHRSGQLDAVLSGELAVPSVAPAAV